MVISEQEWKAWSRLDVHDLYLDTHMAVMGGLPKEGSSRGNG